MLDVRRFSEYLEPLNRCAVKIFFPQEDSEAFQFSMTLQHALTIANWDVAEPRPLPPSTLGVPAHIEFGASPQGITIFCRTEPDSLGSPYKILTDAFAHIEFPHRVSGRIDLRVPPDMLWIVVGPKI